MDTEEKIEIITALTMTATLVGLQINRVRKLRKIAKADKVLDARTDELEMLARLQTL
jgi:hypothetical protein